MKVAIVASECTPFAKTGGLADVVGALPKHLAALGVDVKVFIPKYDSIDEKKYGLKFLDSVGELQVRMGQALHRIRLSRRGRPRRRFSNWRRKVCRHQMRTHRRGQHHCDSPVLHRVTQRNVDKD